MWRIQYLFVVVYTEIYKTITDTNMDVLNLVMHIDLGYCWARKIPKFGSRILPRSGLLCSCV